MNNRKDDASYAAGLAIKGAATIAAAAAAKAVMKSKKQKGKGK